MKIVKKILLIIIVLILVNILFMPNIVKADDDDSLSSVLQDVENDVQRSQSTGQNYLANAGLNLSQIFGKFSWLHALAWAAYGIVGGICIVKYGIPALTSTTFMNDQEKSQKVNAFAAFMVIYLVGVIILWRVFPLFVTTDWNS